MSHSTLPSHGHDIAWIALPGSGAPAGHGDVSHARVPAQTYDPPYVDTGLLGEQAPTSSKKTAAVELASIASDEKRAQARGTWLPVMLRPLPLAIVAAFALALSITLAVLCWYSVRHTGLGSDDTYFVWKYIPTILAVLFTLAMAMIYDDIRRTEPFARLAHPTRVDTKHTLLYKPKAWFKTITEGFSKQHKTGRVLLVVSSLATGLTVLAISTLSSSLMVARQVVAPNTVDLQRFVSGKDGKIELAPLRETYFHTTSGYVYNASTSMWVTDSHVVLPFQIPASKNFAGSLANGIWEAETKVLQMESTCVPMSFGAFEKFNISYYDETDNMTFTYYSTLFNERYPLVNVARHRTMHGFNIKSEDGCKIHVGGSAFTSENDVAAGVFWSNMSSSHVSWPQFANDAGGMPVLSDSHWSPLNDRVLLDFSDECLDRNLLLISRSWPNSPSQNWTDFKTRAELCKKDYYEAILPVNASISGTDEAVTFDKDEFSRRRRPIDKEYIDIEYFNRLSFQGNRPDYLNKASIFTVSPGREGLKDALLLLDAGSNATTLMNDPELPARAARLHSRFFNELIISSVTQQESPVLEGIKGRSIILERRVFVVTEIAIALAVLFFVLACYLLGLLRAVSVRRRPLNLSSDPATTIGLATYLNQNSDLVTKSSLDVHAHREQTDHVGNIHGTSTAYNPGYALERELSLPTSQLSSLSNDWRPASLHTLSLTGQMIAFALLAAALLVLQNLAKREKLYNSAFVFELDVEIFKATISPFSLLGTFIAVGLALWWDMMEKNMRLLQPYLSMAKRPRVVKRGTGLSYQSSYWVGAAVKAASNRDWLLSLVTVGTTLSQVLVIAMAAVFERQPGHHNQPTSVSPMLVDRVTPLKYSSGEKRAWRDIMFSNTGDWMYSALDQIALGAPPPNWSKDGWVFAPINMDLLPATTKQRGKSQDDEQNSASVLVSTSNVTLETTAMRARLQCEAVPIHDDKWLTDEVAVLVSENNRTIKNISASTLNITGKMLPTRLFVNTSLETTTLTGPYRVLCCSNETEEAKSAVAYWSFVNGSTWISDSDLLWTGDVPIGDEWPSNILIKNIVGSAYTTTMTIYTNNLPSFYTPLQFKEVPGLQALDCKPIIEQTKARVKVARSSAEVLDFELLEEPQPRSDVWKLNFDIQKDAEQYKRSSLISRQATRPPPPPPTSGFLDVINSTTNYTAEIGFGTYFMAQLLKSPRIESGGHTDVLNFEELSDERFTIRDAVLGINMDFMSYSTWLLAQKDSMALLDAATLLNHSQETFQTFFQHYASHTNWTDGERIAFTKADKDNSQDVAVTTTDHIEVLAMIDSATWLCLAIIFILMLILVTLTITLRLAYPPTLMNQKVECLADMLVLIAGSDELLAHVEGKSDSELSRSGIRTRLGWFKDKLGVVRWGIEVESVEWVERPKRSFES